MFSRKTLTPEPGLHAGSTVDTDLIDQPLHLGVSALNKSSTFCQKAETFFKKLSDGRESICLIEVGSGASTAVWGGTRGGEGGDLVAQPVKLAAVSSTAHFKSLAFVCPSIFQLLLFGRMFGPNTCHSLDVLTGRFLTHRSLVCGQGLRLGDLGLELGDSQFLNAEHSHYSSEPRRVDPGRDEAHTNPAYFGARTMSTSLTWCLLMSQADRLP